MPRKRRKISLYDVYHVVIRGVAKRIIFEDDEDRRRFITTLERFTYEMNVSLHAWCLMSNHVHLLVKTPFEQLSTFMKKVQISYVAYFNKKYDRCGHLFQDRFRSEPVNDDYYFMSVIRYIHQNPIVAGVTDSLKYKWSSYEEYLGKRGFLDRSPISLFTEEGGFVEYHRQQGKEDENRHMRAYLPRSHISDARASALIKARFGFNVFSRIESAERHVRDILLSAIKELGYPIRQLARLTGLGRRVIQEA